MNDRARNYPKESRKGGIQEYLNLNIKFPGLLTSWLP
jgi:hypothetical protein